MKCTELWSVRVPTMAFESKGKLQGESGRIRSWTDVNGLFAVTAELDRIENETVYLRREDGRSISIDIDKLSAEDRKHLRETHVESPFVVE